MSAPTIPFSELSKNAKHVMDTLARTLRVHITRRDGEDLYLTTARHERNRDETADLTARLFAALAGSEDGERVLRAALPDVLPWVRHLSAEETREFVTDLVDAVRDAAELDVHTNLHRTIVEWRATARILADPELTAHLTRDLPDVDCGTVAAP